MWMTVDRNLIHMTLVRPLQQDSDPAWKAQVGSALSQFFDSPPSARPALVRSVGKRVVEVAGPRFETIFRVDVTEANEAARTLRVVVEAKPRHGKDVTWTFNLAAPKPPFPDSKVGWSRRIALL